MATKPKKRGRARLGDSVSTAPIECETRGLIMLPMPATEGRPPGWAYADEAVVKAKVKKLRDLMPVYGIEISDPRSFMYLAMMLADEYHPGFRVIDQNPRGRGAPRKDAAAAANFLAVEEKMARGSSFQEACLALAEGDRKKASTIKRRYYEQRNKLPAERRRRRLQP